MKNSKKTAQKCWKTIEMAKRKHIEFGVSEKATLLICERARRTMNESVVNWQASKVIPIWNNSLLQAECFLVQLHRSERIFSLALCVSLRFFFFHSFSSVYRSFSWWFLLGKHTSSWFDGPLNSSLFYTVFRLDSVFFFISVALAMIRDALVIIVDALIRSMNPSLSVSHSFSLPSSPPHIRQH